jgi:hypothetical protein
VTTLTSGVTALVEASAVTGSLQPPRSGDNPAIRRATDVSRELNLGI